MAYSNFHEKFWWSNNFYEYCYSVYHTMKVQDQWVCYNMKKFYKHLVLDDEKEGETSDEIDGERGESVESSPNLLKP
jgi:hypothetical protein